MTDKVYAVYSIPKSPEYKLEGLFRTKESAEKYIIRQKKGETAYREYKAIMNEKYLEKYLAKPRKEEVFDIQIEEIIE